MAVCMATTIANTIQTAENAANTVIHSNNPIIRQAINYGAKGLMNGMMQKFSDPQREAAAGTVGGAVGGALLGITEYLAPGYVDVVDAIVDGAVTAYVDNIRGDIKDTPHIAAGLATTGAAAAFLNSDDIVPSVAISSMDTYRTKGTVNAALYSSIKKNIYNSIYKIMGGSDALKTRDFVNYIPAYVLAAGGSKLSQQAIMDINGAI